MAKQPRAVETIIAHIEWEAKERNIPHKEVFAPFFGHMIKTNPNKWESICNIADGVREGLKQKGIEV